MKFALFYEIPVARPWTKGKEHKAYKDVVEQAVLGDQLGFHSFWTVEHHFLEEFSHCSNPEVLYGHIAARTKNLRLGYGVRLLPKPYNHPVRTAESVAVLDLLSDGRVEFGVGCADFDNDGDVDILLLHRARGVAATLWRKGQSLRISARGSPSTADFSEAPGSRLSRPPRRGPSGPVPGLRRSARRRPPVQPARGRDAPRRQECPLPPRGAWRIRPAARAWAQSSRASAPAGPS